jgi:hypothetical protein
MVSGILEQKNRALMAVTDDIENSPLCIEEFDLSDKNFRPCPCGYQVSGPILGISS